MAQASLRLRSSIAFCAASYVIAAELLITLLQNRVFASIMSNSGVISHRTLNARRSSPPLREHKSVVRRPGYLDKHREFSHAAHRLSLRSHVDAPLH